MMSKQSELGVGQRLALGFALAGASLVILVVLSLLQLHRLVEFRNYHVDVVVPRAEAASLLERAVLRSAIAVREVALRVDETASADLHVAQARAEAALDTLARLPRGQQGNEILARIGPGYRRYQRSVEGLMAAMQADRSPEANRASLQQLAHVRNDLLSPIREYADLQVEVAHTTRLRTGETVSNMQRAIFVFSILVMMTIVATGLWTGQGVIKPVRRLMQAAREVEDGHYEKVEALAPSAEVATSSRNELHTLARAFGRMAGTLRTREARLVAGERLASSMTSSLDVATLCQRALDYAVAEVRAEIGAVYVLSPVDGRLHCKAAHALHGHDETLAVGEGIPGQAVAQNASLVIRDIPQDTVFQVRFGFDSAPPRCVIAAPLTLQGHPMGVLLVGALHALDEHALQFVQHAAMQLSVGVQNATNHEHVQQLATELSERNEELQVQNEELQAQGEELQVQNEELQAQGEELQAQGEELQAQSTELRTALARLAASEERFRRAALDAPFPVALHETEGALLQLSRSWSEAMGFPHEQITTIHDFTKRATDTAEQAAALLADLSSAGVGVEHSIRAANGTPMVWRFRTATLGPVDGRELMVSMAVDVTDQKRAEAGLREADERKNEFLAMLSHELRNPLAPIRNSLHILDRVQNDSDTGERARATIERQVTHLTRLVEDLLDVTRITRGKIALKRAPVELRELLEQCAEDCRSSCAATTRVQTQLPTRAVWVHGDAARLAQVVGNLLQNACKFSPEGARVVLSLEDDAATSRAWIRVSDVGPGIPLHLRDCIFEPFAQAEDTLARSRGGLGLGLALVKGLVDLHEGAVDVTDNATGQGSVFSVALPTIPEPGVAQSIPRSSAATPSYRILVIEDNIDSAESLRELLTLKGHLVEVAHDGLVGTAKAADFQPDVVLCDIGLPGRDGYQVARALRADPRLTGTKIIALTGYALAEDRRRVMESDFDAHLAKPASLDQLEAALAACHVVDATT